MKRYDGTHWDVIANDEMAFLFPNKEERLIRYYFPDQEIPVKFTFNGEEIIPDAKEKETMGEDKPITQFYHSVGDCKFEPLGNKIEPFERLSKPTRVEDFLKNVLGVALCRAVVFPENIVGYDYTKDETNNVAITTIYWADKSTTTCRAPLDKADQYTGFMIAVAKYAMGNKNVATNTADYWINKRPAQLAKEREKVEAEEAEIKRITDKRRKRKEKYRLHIAAVRRKEAYEAAKLANEKYGVPLNFKEDGGDK